MGKNTPVITRAASAPVVDATKAKAAVLAQPEPKQRFRVLRPILHGKSELRPGDLVDMHPHKARHLVETNALAPHVVPQEVSRVIAVDGDATSVTAERASITGAEVAAAIDAPGSESPDATLPIAETDTAGDVRLT